MNKKKIFKIIRKYNHFIWLLFLIFFTILATYSYDLNKKNQIIYLNKSLNNIYLKNSLTKIASMLNPRYVSIEYKVKKGDTYENIINNIDIPNTEKKLFLTTVSKNKNIKILKLNQKIFFKIDKKNNSKIIYFSVEIDKKKIFYLKDPLIRKFLSQKLLKKN